MHNRDGCVEVSTDFWASSIKVEYCRAVGFVDGDTQADLDDWVKDLMGISALTGVPSSR